MRALLVLNFFPAFVPPRSGGEQRSYHLWAAMSRFYDVTLLSPTHPDRVAETVTFGRTFREYRVPKTPLHVGLHARLGRDGLGECSGLVCALASGEEDAYRRTYRELVAGADAVVHESPYMLDYDEGFGRDGRPRIYDSHNVEVRLAASMFPGARGRRYVRFIRDLEGQLVRGCDLVLATSEVERQAFVEEYGCPEDKLGLAPNGFDLASRPDGASETAAEAKRRLGVDPGRPLAIFVGSAHPPNVEAARLLCERIAPALPSVGFVIVGSVCAALAPGPANVDRLGVLDDDGRARLYRACDVALNPMVSGAGTNLKLLDYLGAGLAVVTTPFGARGIPVEPGRHCVVAEPDAFAPAIVALTADRERRERLGRAGAALVHAGFTWPAIARPLRERIDALLERRRRSRQPSRPRLLVLNDYPISSGTSGGAVRIRQLFGRLARHAEVTLLCLADDATARSVPITRHFTEVRIPKTTAHRRQTEEWNARHPVPTSDLVSALMCADNAELVAAYRRLLRRTDVVIVEHPYLVGLLDVERPAVPVIYEAQNVETAMKAQTLGDHPDRDRLLALVERLEARACEVADCVVCVSAEDRDLFARRIDGEKVVVVGNGADTAVYAHESEPAAEIRGWLGGRAMAVFMGSGHPPNVDAVRFIVDELAPRHPEVAFCVLGGSADTLRDTPRPGNVLLCGTVSEREKEVLLRAADVALNPMRSGGGSSLKIAEYLAAGLPLLSTEVGLRGYDLRPGRDTAVADLSTFSAELAVLLDDPGRRARLREHGRDVARASLDWDVSAETYRALVRSLRAERPKRLLAVTFRFTDPPRGGSESYLLEVLTRLRAGGRFVIDVATFDVGTITDRLHFSARYEAGRHAAPAWARRVHGFVPAAMDPREAFERCRALHAMWREEDLVQGRRFAQRFDDMVLLGGWYPPERHGPGLRRWTGARAEIHSPTSLDALELSGVADGETPVTVAAHGRTLLREVVRGDFSIRVELRDVPPGVLTVETEARTRAADDPRPLGICVTEIRTVSAAGASRLPLDRDFGALLRRDSPETWVGSLIAATRGRDGADDAAFLAVRGPSAPEFERWLRDAVAGYDLVLAHGMPFSPAALAVDEASRAGVPCAVLPHYHADDKFYHWQSYYEAFAAAELVLAFPDRSKPYFFDAIGANGLRVPGGGVSPEEFEDVDAAAREFRRMHTSSRPFVLVLGRKAGAKRYDRVVRAVDALRAGGQSCEVVLIGPDEDGAPVGGDGVHYYGRRPRRFVLGALASCAALATMSESESFGIVVVEAWMCRAPVIANRDCLAFRELVEHDVDGLLCGTDAELTAAIGRLLAEPALRERLAARGHDKARARFTWDRIAEAIGHALVSIAR